MSMISDLADRLRVESESMGKYGVDYMATLLMQASDTIIMLSEKARADRPQGEWIDAEIPLESGGSMPIQACNLCKTFYPLAYTGGGHRFCPSCGARMKGADDERVR